MNNTQHICALNEPDKAFCAECDELHFLSDKGLCEPSCSIAPTDCLNILPSNTECFNRSTTQQCDTCLNNYYSDAGKCKPQ
eukprot:Awhi_evm1s7570